MPKIQPSIISPHNADAERAVLGVILLEGRRALATVAWLTPEAFYFEGHRAVCRSIKRLERGAEAVSLLTVSDDLARAGELDLADGPAGLALLVEQASIESHLESYARIVMRDWQLREVIRIAEDARAAAYNGQGPSPELLIEQMIASARAVSEASGGRSHHPGLAFTDMGALLNEPPEEQAWLVEGRLIRGGFSVLAGKPKAGKSTLARTLAFCVARGEPWLGFGVVQGAVLYVALEEKRDEVRQHFAALGARESDPIRSYIARAPQDAFARLRADVEAYQPDLVIIDTLFRFERVADLNDYATVNKALEPYNELARESGAHIMAVHHLGKGDHSGGDAVLGSTAIVGAVDAVLMLNRTEQYRLLSTIQRYGADLPELTVALDPETRMAAAGRSREDADGERAIEAILAHLETLSAPSDERAILEAVEGRQKVKVKALRDLRKRGLIGREGAGRRGDPFRYFAKHEPHDREPGDEADSPTLVPAQYAESENEKRDTSASARRSAAHSPTRDLVSTPNSRSGRVRETASVGAAVVDPWQR
jgi:hypothetical protein